MHTIKYSLHVSGFKLAIYKRNVASKSLYASDDREKPHQTSQKSTLWLYEEKSKVMAAYVMKASGAVGV